MPISHFIVWVSVDTVHGVKLESIIGKKENGPDHDPGDFANSLVSMVKKEFLKNPDICFHEYDLYGHLTYSVYVDKIENIQRVIDRCEKVNNRWVNKHRINGMRDSVSIV